MERALAALLAGVAVELAETEEPRPGVVAVAVEFLRVEAALAVAVADRLAPQEVQWGVGRLAEQQLVLPLQWEVVGVLLILR
jgi:hypothetical protein